MCSINACSCDACDGALLAQLVSTSVCLSRLGEASAWTCLLWRCIMAYLKDSKSAAVRARLDHPVIDGDGHWLEPVPIFLDYLREVGGPSMVERFERRAKDVGWYNMTPQERMDK